MTQADSWLSKEFLLPHHLVGRCINCAINAVWIANVLSGGCGCCCSSSSIHDFISTSVWHVTLSWDEGRFLKGYLTSYVWASHSPCLYVCVLNCRHNCGRQQQQWVRCVVRGFISSTYSQMEEESIPELPCMYLTEELRAVTTMIHLCSSTSAIQDCLMFGKRWGENLNQDSFENLFRVDGSSLIPTLSFNQAASAKWDRVADKRHQSSGVWCLKPIFQISITCTEVMSVFQQHCQPWTHQEGTEKLVHRCRSLEPHKEIYNI